MSIWIPGSATRSGAEASGASPARFSWGFALGWLARLASELPLGSVTVLVTLVVIAVFAGLIAPGDPLQGTLSERLKPPVFAGGTWQHILGTDANGRDILTRIIYGTRIDLPIAVISLASGAALGTIIGLVSGYLGGNTDRILMRFCDLASTYPIFLLAVLLAVVVGPSATNVIITMVFSLWGRFARMVRGDVLSVRERDFVALAMVAGCSHLRIMSLHILPNIINSVVVLASLQMGWVIVVAASLSFLGAGVPPPAPSWGSMISEGRDYVLRAWWLSTMPGVAIMLTVLSLNLLGDWLRDRLDPKLRQL
jgi:peptide/nickel transport system permease protein